jgi:predicted DCC family thiol-disulfide oxidoreductase YuxK
MNNYPLTLLYDESCPLCKLEMDNLKARNRCATQGDSQGKPLLQFIDVSAADFDDSAYPASRQEMMDIIHALRPDGSVVKGVEVFRLAYGAVGLGWLTAPTKLPVIKALCDWIYPHIARNRYRLSSRFSGVLYKIAADRTAKRAMKNSQHCKNGVCAIKTQHEQSDA